MSYAEGTSVAPDRSRDEIERTLRRYGAEAFMYGWDADRAMIQFTASGRLIRFLVAMPDRSAREFTHTPTGKPRKAGPATEAWDQACRQRWRALALVIKAKLEAVASGIALFEDEFLAQTVLPDGSTAGEWIRPQIEVAYAERRMPSALPELGPAR